MTDTHGNVINIGDVICIPGKGNRNAEYGMITGVVTGIQNEKVKFNRINVRYENRKPILSIVNRSIGQGKFIKVTSCPVSIMEWLHGNFQNEETKIVKWIHKGIIE